MVINKKSLEIMYIETLKYDGLDRTLPENGETMSILHAKVFLGNVYEVKRLLGIGEHVADINTPSSVSGHTPLHTAARAGSTEIVILLLENGADITFTDNKGHTALYYSIRFKHTDILELLIANE